MAANNAFSSIEDVLLIAQLLLVTDTSEGSFAIPCLHKSFTTAQRYLDVFSYFQYTERRIYCLFPP